MRRQLSSTSEETLTRWLQSYPALLRGCVSTIDPRVVEYVCKTNAANYRDRLLPPVFDLVLKGLGVTGSQGDYNRQHRKAGLD